MRIAMISYAQTGVLAGSLDGQRAFVDLLQKTEGLVEPSVCYLDFAGIDVATTSFLRDSVIAYRNHTCATRRSVHPVCANLGQRVREEFQLFLFERGDAFVSCVLDGKNRVRDAQVLGKVDGKLGIALAAVIELGEVDATGLRAHSTENVARTAWNNRLSALVAKGILIETGSGRNKFYRPVLEGLRYGT